MTTVAYLARVLTELVEQGRGELVVVIEVADLLLELESVSVVTLMVPAEEVVIQLAAAGPRI